MFCWVAIEKHHAVQARWYKRLFTRNAAFFLSAGLGGGADSF